MCLLTYSDESPSGKWRRFQTKIFTQCVNIILILNKCRHLQPLLCITCIFWHSIASHNKKDFINWILHFYVFNSFLIETILVQILVDINFYLKRKEYSTAICLQKRSKVNWMKQVYHLKRIEHECDQLQIRQSLHFIIWQYHLISM